MTRWSIGESLQHRAATRPPCRCPASSQRGNSCRFRCCALRSRRPASRAPVPPLDAAGMPLQTSLNPSFQLVRGCELHRALICFARPTFCSIRPKRLRLLLGQRVQALQKALNELAALVYRKRQGHFFDGVDVHGLDLAPGFIRAKSARRDSFAGMASQVKGPLIRAGQVSVRPGTVVHPAGERTPNARDQRRRAVESAALPCGAAVTFHGRILRSTGPISRSATSVSWATCARSQ